MSVFAGRGEAARRRGVVKTGRVERKCRVSSRKRWDQEHWWKKPVYPWSYPQ